ncbi:hypothetical protein K2X89_12710 [Myxococcota bacterium]|nr:hypothetical protein [Myxococcota bacterium]
MASRASKAKGGTRRSTRRTSPIDDALARLERDIPRLLRQLRSNVRELQTQVDRARADGEKRWRLAEGKLKKDAARIRQGLESAIGRVRGGGKAARAKVSGAAAKAKARSGRRTGGGTRKRRG